MLIADVVFWRSAMESAQSVSAVCEQVVNACIRLNSTLSIQILDSQCLRLESNLHFREQAQKI